MWLTHIKAARAFRDFCFLAVSTSKWVSLSGDRPLLREKTPVHSSNERNPLSPGGLLINDFSDWEDGVQVLHVLEYPV